MAAMAALCGRSGLWKCGFQASLVVNKMHQSNSLMFPTRRYSCLAGKIQSVTRNLQQVPNNSILQALKYAAQQTRLVHGQRCLAVPIVCRRPTLTMLSAIRFASLRNKLWPNLELQLPSGVNGTRFLATVNQYRWKKVRTKADMPKKIIPKSKRILLGPQRKGVCIKVFVRKPKKPNSGNRKCALLKLSNGRVITAYIPGERAVLQEHGVVLFEGGRVQDCPGVKYKIIRKKYDMN